MYNRNLIYLNLVLKVDKDQYDRYARHKRREAENLQSQNRPPSSYAEAVNTAKPCFPGARANPQLQVRLCPEGNYTYYTFHHIYRIVAAISQTTHLIGNRKIYVSYYFFQNSFSKTCPQTKSRIWSISRG